MGTTNWGDRFKKSSSLASVAFMSELSSEGAVLEGGEEGVYFGEGGLLSGPQPLHPSECIAERAL